MEKRSMYYLNQLTLPMINDLMRCYAPSYTDIEVTFNRYGKTNQLVSIDVELTVDGLPETYSIEDGFTVAVYDWDDSEGTEHIEFRKKMLEYFGTQYAVDYLLTNI